MFKNYLIALKAYHGTFSLIQKLGLWKYFIIPIGISFFIALIIGFAAWGWSDNLGAFISSVWIWEWGAETVKILSGIAGAMLIVLFGFILYKHLVLALSAPFMNPVSEKIEVHITGKPYHSNHTGFVQQLWRGIRVNSRNLIMELLLTVPILLVGLLPVVGILAAPLLFLVQAYYAGFGNMDYTLERYFTYQKSISFVRSHRGIAMGNGTVFMFLLLIPVFGVLIVLPFSVTAATISTIHLLHPKKTF